MRDSMMVTAVALWAGASTDIASAAHPFHATLAEMEWNEAHGRFEVSLQLPGPEIENELSALHGRRINMETTPDAESLLQKYIEQHFRVADAHHSSCRLRWVGIEVEIRSVWAYFEVELIPDEMSDRQTMTSPSFGESDGLKLHCTIMVESRGDQVNLVNLTKGNMEASLHLTAEQPSAPVDFKRRSRRPDAASSR